jgi:membrane protease YdiL (CAAX protease family)
VVWYLVGLGTFGTAGDVWESLLYDVLSTLLLAILGLMVIYKLADVRPKDYWITSPFAKRGIPEVVALIFLSAMLLLTYVVIANIVTPREVPPNNDYEHPADLGATASLLIIVYRSAAASFAEEIFYRGLPRLVFGAGRSMLRTVAYVLVSSTIFGLMHAPYGAHAVVPAVYFAVIAALILLWTNNLWFLFAGHFLTDAVIMWWRYAKYGVLSV